MAMLRDILAKVKTSDVVEVLRRIYGAEAEWLPEAVANVVDELRRLTPDGSGGEYELRIEPAEALDPGDKPSWEVWYAKDNDNERYCISLSPWEEWLSLRVPQVLLDTMPEAEIVAHCIWDMTFYGFTQECIAENRAELDQRAREIDEGKAECIPMEQVMERLRAEFGWNKEPLAETNFRFCGRSPRFTPRHKRGIICL